MYAGAADVATLTSAADYVTALGRIWVAGRGRSKSPIGRRVARVAGRVNAPVKLVGSATEE